MIILYALKSDTLPPRLEVVGHGGLHPRLMLGRFVLTQARSASEGKAVPRWRFGLVSEQTASRVYL
jgi:hypothetical protein